jgi:hypothetical protein
VGAGLGALGDDRTDAGLLEAPAKRLTLNGFRVSARVRTIDSVISAGVR